MTEWRNLYRWPLEYIFRAWDFVFCDRPRVCQWRRRVLWWYPKESQFTRWMRQTKGGE